MRNILDRVLGVSAKLPPLLSYGACIVVAVIAMAIYGWKSGAESPIAYLILIALIFLVALASFVYLDVKHRSKIRPIKEVLSAIEKALNRKTFNEPLRECTDQQWISRYRGICETSALLEQYQESIEAAGSDSQKRVFSRLLKEVNGYAMDLASFLVEQKRFDYGSDGKLQIPPNVEKPCEEHRKAVQKLRGELGSASKG